MRLHAPFPRHNRTPYVAIEVALCAVCGACVATCPQGVLGMVSFLGHRHVHVDRAEACRGCGKCVFVCPQEAFRRVEAQTAGV